ncbi:hypothetical protein Tco_0853608 [Tanacetum coccineum]|uniref:Uncharacterized protein n=1 Tax=Tanacetum coccineum TaxID=301880 RepID=A0ABQ4WDC8_9ASTR
MSIPRHPTCHVQAHTSALPLWLLYSVLPDFFYSTWLSIAWACDCTHFEKDASGSAHSDRISKIVDDLRSASVSNKTRQYTYVPSDWLSLWVGRSCESDLASYQTSYVAPIGSSLMSSLADKDTLSTVVKEGVWGEVTVVWIVSINGVIVVDTSSLYASLMEWESNIRVRSLAYLEIRAVTQWRPFSTSEIPLIISRDLDVPCSCGSSEYIRSN